MSAIPGRITRQSNGAAMCPGIATQIAAPSSGNSIAPHSNTSPAITLPQNSRVSDKGRCTKNAHWSRRRSGSVCINPIRLAVSADPITVIARKPSSSNDVGPRHAYGLRMPYNTKPMTTAVASMHNAAHLPFSRISFQMIAFMTALLIPAG